MALLATCGNLFAASSLTQTGATFNGQGPGPSTGYYDLVGSGDTPPNGNVGGAIQAIAVSPTDPNTIYVGAVGGGVWRSTNGGATWGALTDSLASISIGSLAFDPNDATNRTLVAGVGAVSNGGWRSISVFSTPSNFGGVLNGLLYSTDAAATWSNIGSAALAGQSVVDVAARGSMIMAATFEPRIAGWSPAGFTGGLYRSTDTGASFTLVSGASGSGLPLGPVTSLVGDPANPNRFYAAVTSTTDSSKTGVYVSADNGAHWTQIYNYASTSAALKVAAGPGGALAFGATTSGVLDALYYSGDSGATWSALTTPNVNQGGQAPVNFALAIDPTNTRYLYVAGDNDCYANPCSNALAIVRIDAKANSSTPLSDFNAGVPVNTGNGSFVHPDARALVVAPNGNLLTSTDGGLYARTNPLTSAGVWQNLNGNLSTMELYSVAYDSVSKRLVASAQDNGSSYQSTAGGAVYRPINGGDGINAVVNDTTLSGQSAIYVSAQNLSVARAIVDKTGAIVSPNSPDQMAVPVNFTLAPGDSSNFQSPLVLNNIVQTRMALAGGDVYVTQDTLTGANGVGATSVNLNLTDVGSSGKVITAIDYGTKNNPNALVAGGGLFDNPNGSVYFSSTAAAGSLTTAAGYTGMAPTSVKFDLRSDQRFFVADSLNLYGSTNQGATFTTLTGNLPANFIRPTSLAFVDSNGVDALLVGGLNDAANVGNPLTVADSDASGVLSGWRRFGSGLPNTTVTSLSFNPVTDTLAVGADGRGAFLLYDFTSNFSTAQVLQFGLADNNSTPDPSVLTGDRPLVKYGPGVLTITGAATYTGSTTILGGTMLAGAANVFAPHSQVNLAAGFLDLGGFDNRIGSLYGSGAITNSGVGSPAVLTTGGDNNSTTFAGSIQDGVSPTGLTKTGTGVFTLSGANTYTGDTTVSAGTLRGGAANTFSAASATTIDMGGALDLGGFAQTINNVLLSGGTVQNGDLTGAISSSGGFIDSIGGTSSLTTTGGVTTLIGVNVFWSVANAGMLVNNGVTTDDLNNTGTVINNVTYNAAVAFNSGTITNSAGANWNGDVKAGANVAGGLIINAGTWTGTGNNAGGAIDNQGRWIGQIVNTAGAFTNEGTVSAGMTNSGSASNSGAISGGVANSGTFGNLSGGSITGGLTNTAGTFTNASGATLDAANVIGGTLVDRGTISGAAVVGSGATLAGSGTIGSLSAQGGSIIAPGLVSPYATLTVVGAATFAPGSTFLANINAAGQNDRLKVGGGLTINGAGVQVLAAPGTYSPTTTYTLINAQGGVNGTFSSLSTTSNLAFLSPFLTYDANDVFLRFRAIADFASVAQTPNQLAVANALQPLGFGSPLYTAVVEQTPAGARQAFNALSGEIHASAMTAALEDTRLPRQAVLDRLSTAYADLSGSGSPFMASANVGLKDLSQVWTTWGQAFGSSSHVSGNGNAAYLNDGLFGFIYGADATIDSRYRFGVAAAYTHSALSDPQRNASGRIDSTSIGVYGGTSQQALQLRGGGFYTFNHFNTTNNVAFPGFYGSDGTGYDGGVLQAFGEAGWRIGLPASYGRASWVEPFVGLQGAQLNTGSFAETGSAAALLGSSGSFGYGASTLGVRAQLSLLDNMPLTLHTMLGWQYVFGALDPASRLAFASAPASPFTVFGAPLTRSALTAEIGADWRVSKAATLGVYYSGLIGGGVNDNAVKGKFEMAF